MSKLRRIGIKVLKWLAYIGLTLLLLIILLWLALQSPIVQTRIAKRVTEYLSERIHSRFELESIDIDFFNRLVLNGVYVEDLKGDTLLYAGSLKADLSIFAPLQQRIGIEGISLEQTVVNLNRARDSLFNFQFIIDAFASDTPKDTTKSDSAPWTLDLDRLRLKNVRFKLIDSLGSMALNTQVNAFDARLRTFDLPEQTLDFRSLSLNGSTTAFRTWAVTDTSALSKKPSRPLSFPYPGWQLSADEIRLAGNNFSLDNLNNPTDSSGRFDPTHLNFKELELTLNDFEWTPETLNGQIEQLTFQEGENFKLENLETTFALSDEKITLSDLQLQTPQSTLAPTTAHLTFPNFNALTNFVEEVLLDIDLSRSSFAVAELEYWAGPIPALAQWKKETIEFESRLIGTIPDLNIQQFTASINTRNELILNGRIRGLPDPKQLAFDIDLQRLSTSYEALTALNIKVPEGLKNFGQVQLSTLLEGPISDLKARKVTLTTERYTAFRGMIATTGLPDVDKLEFQLNIRELRTAPEDFAGFLKDTIPPPLAALGRLQYSGKLGGTVRELALDGLLKSQVGQIDQKVKIRFSKDYKDASYEGNLNLSGFQLDRLLDNSQLGSASMQLEVKGSGLALDSLHTELDATIRQFQFRDYDYKDIAIDGRVDARQFEGKLAIDDENLRFQFEGLANLNDSVPDLQFNALLDTANLEALKLYATPLHLHSRLNFNLRGNSVDNFEGTAALSNFSITDEIKRYQTDSLILLAEAPDSERRVVQLKSDIVNARLSGQYDISNLQPLVLKFINDLFPIEDMVDNAILADTILDSRPQKFNFQMALSKPTRLTKVLYPQLEELDTAWFNLRLNSETREIAISSLVPSLTLSGITIDSLKLESEGSTKSISNLITSSVIRSKEQLLAANINLQANLLKDSLYFRLAAADSPEMKDDRIVLQAISLPRDDDYVVKLISPLTLNGVDWKAPINNRVLFRKNNIHVKDVRIQHEGQTLYVDSQGPPQDDQFVPLAVGFKNFQLSELAELAGLNASYLDGALNGALTLTRPDTTLIYNIDFDIANLLLDKEPLGDVSINAKPNVTQQFLNIQFGLNGGKNEVSLNGKYGLEDQALNFKLQIPKLQLAPLDFFSFGNIKDSRGRITAELDIKGSAKEPVVTGYTRFENATTFVDYLKTRFLLPEHTIQFEESAINIGHMELKDIEGRPATLSGQIRHDHFKDMQLDLRFNSPAMLVLNTSSQDNKLFYGTVVVSANATIRGTPSAPKIDMNTRTLSGTNLTAVPLGGDRAIAQESFIIYQNPETYKRDTAESANQYRTNTTGLDLSLRLDLTPEAKLITIIDPETGDRLEVQGDANLVIEMEPNGQLRTTGNIYLTEGNYFLNFEGLVRRNFTIRPGSTIYLPGDPLDAQFDITAIYTARTNVYDLISNQLNLDDSQEAAARRRQNINVLMNIKGTLAQPEISFRIEPGENVAGGISEAVTQRLNQLEEQESELNKQVFGLLIFNSFLSTNASSTFASAGENIALKSVSSFLTRQLNQLADQYIEGIDLSIGLESYNTANASNVTELQLGVSKQLFNERLSVQVGGNVGVNSPGGGQGSSTTIAGSFLLEYKLTADGRYRVRVFRRPDTDIFTEGIRTGAGIIFKKSFGTIKPDSTKSTKPHNE